MGLSDMCPILGGLWGLGTGDKMPRNALIVGLRGVRFKNGTFKLKVWQFPIFFAGLSV
ncbi:hypothetical protein NHP190002_10850 [Helicobacter ailurogastricus]|nr:hypothetical protein NHP190002_10850 [Helicobacter ailurogastricus]